MYFPGWFYAFVLHRFSPGLKGFCYWRTPRFWDSASNPVKGKTTVVITSGNKSAGKKENSTWENRWQQYIDEESLKIAEKIILSDSTPKTYTILLEYSINEDGTLKDVLISCSPKNKFVEKDCYKMVINAPKKHLSIIMVNMCVHT